MPILHRSLWSKCYFGRLSTKLVLKSAVRQLDAPVREDPFTFRYIQAYPAYKTHTVCQVSRSSPHPPSARTRAGACSTHISQAVTHSCPELVPAWPSRAHLLATLRHLAMPHRRSGNKTRLNRHFTSVVATCTAAAMACTHVVPCDWSCIRCRTDVRMPGTCRPARTRAVRPAAHCYQHLSTW